MTGILGCAGRNIASRIKQVVVPVRQSLRRSRDKSKASSEKDSQIGEGSEGSHVLERPVEIPGMFNLCQILQPDHIPFLVLSVLFSLCGFCTYYFSTILFMYGGEFLFILRF